MNTLRYLAETIESRKPISRSSYDECGADCVYRVLIIFKTAYFNMEMKSRSLGSLTRWPTIQTKLRQDKAKPSQAEPSRAKQIHTKPI